jgi:hypothetical protein
MGGFSTASSKKSILRRTSFSFNGAHPNILT